MYAEQEKEIKYMRIENEMIRCLLINDPNSINISNMIKVLRENEEMKRAIELYETIFAG
jgi:hypothetical protein